MENCSSDVLNVRFRGKTTSVPAVRVGGVTVISTGQFLRIGEIFDEYWLPRELLPSYDLVIAELIKRGDRPDIFTFAQRVPDVGLAYNYYHDFDNYAVLSLPIYDEWLQRKIPRTTRQNIRASAKRGIVVRVSAYHDDYVGGIMSIYNETPVRAGKRFWHFGKNFETVKAETGTYAERSTFLAAFRGQEMVGFLKIVWDVHTAGIMQILSKTSARPCRPNNALLAEAVRQCCLRNVGYLLYGNFDYGQKFGDSLTNSSGTMDLFEWMCQDTMSRSQDGGLLLSDWVSTRISQKGCRSRSRLNFEASGQSGIIGSLVGHKLLRGYAWWGSAEAPGHSRLLRRVCPVPEDKVHRLCNSRSEPVRLSRAGGGKTFELRARARPAHCSARPFNSASRRAHR